MIFGFVLLLSVSLTPVIPNVAAQGVDDEIIVIGERLQKWTGKYKIRGDKMRCKTKQSTGDPKIDAVGCTAFETCAEKLKTEISATDAKDLDKNSRKAMKIAVKQELSSCVTDQRKTLIAKLADERSQIN